MTTTMKNWSSNMKISEPEKLKKPQSDVKSRIMKTYKRQS